MLREGNRTESVLVGDALYALYALDTRCPHEGGHIVTGPLADGIHADCPLHNYRFDPQIGEPWQPVKGEDLRGAQARREQRGLAVDASVGNEACWGADMRAWERTQ